MSDKAFDLDAAGIPKAQAPTPAKGPTDGGEKTDGKADKAVATSGGGANPYPFDAKEADEIDEQIKAAVRKNIVNHELTCLVIDLVSPGKAISKIGLGALDNLPPMQHLAVAVTAVGVTLLATNPALIAKLRGSIGKNKSLPPEQRAAKSAGVALPPKVERVAARAAESGDPLAAIGAKTFSDEPSGDEI